MLYNRELPNSVSRGISCCIECGKLIFRCEVDIDPIFDPIYGLGKSWGLWGVDWGAGVLGVEEADNPRKPENPGNPAIPVIFQKCRGDACRAGTLQSVLRDMELLLEDRRDVGGVPRGVRGGKRGDNLCDGDGDGDW